MTSLSGGTGHTRLQGHTVQTSVILEKAVEEVIRHLRDLQDSIKDNSSSHISKQQTEMNQRELMNPGVRRLSEKAFSMKQMYLPARHRYASLRIAP